MPSSSTLIKSAIAVTGAALIARQILRVQRRLDLTNRVAVVTGGSRGLGLCIARELVRRGARVAICARTESQIRSAQADLLGRVRNPSDEPAVFAAVADVTVPAQTAAFLEQVQSTLGPVDVLVNNAGVISVGPLETQSLKDFDRSLDTHLRAPYRLIRSLLPSMRRRGLGRIVNIASFGGKIPTPHLIPYAAGKFALVGFSESLRAELLRHNIYVTTVCPGLIRTGSPLNAQFKGRAEEEYAWFATGDAMPIVSIDAALLARQIVSAAQYGDAELISPFVASVQTKLHALAPGLSADVAGIVNSFLPSAAGGSRQEYRGRQLDSAKVPPFARAVHARAAALNNEL